MIRIKFDFFLKFFGSVYFICFICIWKEIIISHLIKALMFYRMWKFLRIWKEVIISHLIEALMFCRM